MLTAHPPAAVVYLVSQAVGNFARGLVYTVLAVYYITAVGLNPFQLVFVGTVLELAGLLFELPTGVLADVYGRRRSVIVGRLLIGAMFVLQGLTNRLAIVLLAEAKRALGEACLNGATQAWLADEVGEQHLRSLFIRGAQVRSVAYLLGVVVSVALASWQLNAPILAGGGLTILLAVFLAAVMPEHRSTARSLVEADVPRRWRQLRTSALDGTRAVSSHSMLRLLLGLAVCAGAASEGLDRLREAHFLETFSLPPLGNLQPIVWFGIIDAGALLLGLGALRLVRDLNTEPLSLQLRFLRVLQVLRIVAIVGFGLAPNFALALVLFWVARVASYVGNPFLRDVADTHQPRIVAGDGRVRDRRRRCAGPGRRWTRHRCDRNGAHASCRDRRDRPAADTLHGPAHLRWPTES